VRTNSRSKSKFKGVLAEPISPFFNAFAHPTIKEKAEYLASQRFLRVLELAKHYGIELSTTDGSFRFGLYRLLLRLAEEFVPGFRVGVTAGRPRGSGKSDNPKLVADIDKLRGKGMSLSSACVHLSKKRRQGETPGALKLRYYRYKPPQLSPELNRLYQQLVGYSESPGSTKSY
jgi:hypothetical protein